MIPVILALVAAAAMNLLLRSFPNADAAVASWKNNCGK
jgi:hypothetical protein